MKLNFVQILGFVLAMLYSCKNVSKIDNNKIIASRQNSFCQIEYNSNGTVFKIKQFNKPDIEPPVVREFGTYPDEDSSLTKVTEYIFNGSWYPSRWLRFDNRARFDPIASHYYTSELTQKNGENILTVKGSFFENDSVYFYLVTDNIKANDWKNVYPMTESSPNNFEVSLKLPSDLKTDTIKGIVLPCKLRTEIPYGYAGEPMVYNYVPGRDFLFEKILFEYVTEYWSTRK